MAKYNLKHFHNHNITIYYIPTFGLIEFLIFHSSSIIYIPTNSQS